MPEATAALNAALEGRYRLERLLGHGGMARVYLADDLRHGRKVAIKVLRSELTEVVGVERFQSEIRTTANLQHPHILPLFDSGEAGGFLFYVMPYVEGDTLRSRLDRDGRLAIDEAVRITMLVSGALQYAHDQGVIHRDVKPENIMFSGDLPVLADFGIALVLQQVDNIRLTEAHTSIGTVLYGSPEQLMGEGDVDERCDLYAMGCVLYELLTGEPPLVGKTAVATIAKKLTEVPAPVRSRREEVPLHLDAAVAKALAVEPADRHSSMRALVDALLGGGARGPVATAAPLGNLPAQATSLIGREAALDEVGGLMANTRLVTLLGMGGLGKTRLAIEVASRSATAFPDGTWFVDLAAVTDPQALGLAAAGAFGVAQQAGKSIEQSLVEALGARRLLLVMDNCEHVVAAAATLTGAILAACPQVKVIATSREALSIAGEHVWPVPPLDTAGPGAPAVELFVDRARAVAPRFALGGDGDVVRAICDTLDGIPLAIELAAARVRSLSPQQILDRLGDRFRLLKGGSRAPDQQRHLTLRHAVQWSFDLLSAAERAVLVRASAFVGGFTLEAAEFLCVGDGVATEDVCDLLDSLVSKSLVVVDRPGNTVRYGMLETIRSFGAERLVEDGEDAAVRRRHGEFFALQSAENFAAWRSPREGEAYDWLDLEIGNLRAAFRWAMNHGEVDIAAQIASDVGDMGRFRLREEAANWAEEVVEAARQVHHRRLTVLLTWSASSAWAYSRFDDARRFGEAALALQDDPELDPFIWAYGDLAFVAILGEGDVDKAIELLRTAGAHPTDRHDRFMLAFLLYILATAGHTEEALAIADEVVAKVDAAGVPMSIAVAYGGKGAAIEAIDPAAALAAYEHAIEVARRSGNRFMEALIAPRLAALHARSGEPVAALGGFERVLVSFGGATDIASVSAWRASLVVLLAKLGHFQAAATLHGTLAGAIDTKGVVPEHPEAVARTRETLGEQAFGVATTRGAAMSLREASDYAIEQVRLGLSSLALTDDG